MEKLTEQIVRTNKYWQDIKYNRAKGGINDMPNCTDFVVCAAAWCVNADGPLKLLQGRSAGGFYNAKLFYSKWLYEKGSAPKVAAIAVWDAAPVNGNCGHVAFVKSFEGNKITVYQSNADLDGKHKYPYFEERTFEVKVGQVTAGVGAKFIGFCYHPTYQEDPKPQPKFIVGKDYKLLYNCVVRSGPGVIYKRKTYNELTPNARKNALPNGCLKANTEVTCLATHQTGQDIWINIPSGWIVGYLDNELIIEQI